MAMCRIEPMVSMVHLLQELEAREVDLAKAGSRCMCKCACVRCAPCATACVLCGRSTLVLASFLSTADDRG